MSCKSYFILFFTFLAISFNVCAVAQNLVRFTSINVKDGLSSNTVTNIVRDRYGIIWFGTTNGLARYDGTNFYTYRHEPDNKFSLSGNEVQAVYEDKQGTLWVGTNVGGIYRYDRKLDRFVNFTGDGSWPEITKITVRSFCQDHFGKIWVATYGGLRTIDPKTGQITKLNIYYPKSELPTFVVLSVYEDSRHRMWVGTNVGLYLYDWPTKKFQRFIHAPNNSASITNDVIKSITEDANGNIWFGTLGGMSEWHSGNKFIAFKHNETISSSISSDVVYAVAGDKDGKLWIGTEDGLNIYDPATQTFSKLKPDSRDVYSLGSESIRSILIDPRGIYWIGTYGGGISKYDKHLALFNKKHSDKFDPLGLKVPIVTSFVGIDNTRILVGTDGGGIESFDPKTGLFKPYQVKINSGQVGTSLSVLSLYVDKAGYLWAGTYYDGLFKINIKTGKCQQYKDDGTLERTTLNKINSITEDNQGNIWAGSSGKGIEIYNPKTGKFKRISGKSNVIQPGPKLPSNDYVAVIRKAPNGDIWIGSIGTGIAVYHQGKGTFTHFLKENSNLADNVVQCMTFTRDGKLWVGTNQGISYFDEKRQKFISYTEKNGLADGFVKMILEDRTGLLWLSTEKGISSFDRSKGVFRNFNSTNGALQSSFIAGSGMKTPDDQIYFGGQDGFNYFYPDKLPLASGPGPVLLTELEVNNIRILPGKNSPIQEQIATAKEIKLAYGQNFSISYVDLDYTSGKQNQYAYRLSNFDKTWNYVHNIETASYTNIDPGDYIFEVKATNSESQKQSPVTKIRVIVLPPLWRTAYAYIFYIILVITALFLIRRRGIQKLKQEFKRNQEKRDISRMIESERQEQARLHELDNLKIKFLTDLSHEFRTPILLILAPVEKLLKKDLADEEIEDIRMVNRNAKRLLNLVNQLLDFRKMEEHAMKLDIQPGNIINFISEAADSFRDIAAKKKITFIIEHENEPRFVLFDSEKIERIIFNLLSNAFKFTPANEWVKICTKVIDQDEKSVHLAITVEDSGVGLPEQEVIKIFDRFYQFHQDNQVINQGTGIGLSITKDFVEMHGGAINAECMPEKGMRFRVELTLIKARIEKQAGLLTGKAASPHVEDLDTEKMPQERLISDKSTTILLVEDNDEFREYLINHLQQYYHIVGAADGKQGWQKTLSVHPQLIVSDINMPQMSGIELCKKIKGDKRTSHLPVILLTAMSGEEEQLKGLKTGANDYLTKPFNFQILNARIENILGLNKSLKDTYSKHINLVSQKIEIESTDLKLLNQVMNYVEEKLTDCDLSVEELSKYVGMSRAALYYKMIEITGLAPTEYIRAIKLEKAAGLLETSKLNVSQVAYMTGFATPSYFSKVFKQKFGIPPTDYITKKRT